MYACSDIYCIWFVGELLLRKTLDPISDVLTLEFGLSHLILDNCGLEDDVCFLKEQAIS